MLTEAAVETVRQSVVEDPLVSSCLRSAPLDIARTLLQKILKLDLKIFPHKIRIVQVLLPQDTHRPLQYVI